MTATDVVSGATSLRSGLLIVSYSRASTRQWIRSARLSPSTCAVRHAVLTQRIQSVWKMDEVRHWYNNKVASASSPLCHAMPESDTCSHATRLRMMMSRTWSWSLTGTKQLESRQKSAQRPSDSTQPHILGRLAQRSCSSLSMMVRGNPSLRLRYERIVVLLTRQPPILTQLYQTRIFAKQPPPTPHHWLHFDLHLQVS